MFQWERNQVKEKEIKKETEKETEKESEKETEQKTKQGTEQETAQPVELDNYQSLPHAYLPSVSKKKAMKRLQVEALKSMDCLLKLVTEQEKKYGCKMAPLSNFYKRHQMVQHFLASQNRKTPGQTRQQLTVSVATNFDWGQTTVRNIVWWESSWVNNWTIPKSAYGDSYAAWMDDKDLKMAVWNYAKKKGQRKWV